MENEVFMRDGGTGVLKALFEGKGGKWVEWMEGEKETANGVGSVRIRYPLLVNVIQAMRRNKHD